MTRLLIIDTGAEEHPIYQALPELRVPVDVTICHNNTKARSSARQRVEHQAERFGVPLHTIEDLPKLLSKDKELPDRVLLIMESAEVKDSVINLMRDLTESRHGSEHPMKIMICNPPGVTSLQDMLELVAYSQVYEIEVWLNARRRYASGVQYLYRHARDIEPLTQMSSSIDTGLYGTGGIAELMQIAWHHTDLLCSIVAAAAANESELAAIPSRLSAEHSGFYRDALSVSFAFGENLVGCLSASTNDKGNLGFREEMRVKGFGSTIELNASLNGCRYINLLDADGYSEIDIDVNADELMAIVERDILGSDTNPVSTLNSLDLQRLDNTMAHLLLEDRSDTETRDSQTDTDNRRRTLQRILLDFMQDEASAFAPTLLSCLPGTWTADAIQRSLGSKRCIDRPDHDVNARIQQTFLNPESYVERGMQLAYDGALEGAIDMFVRRIEQNNHQIQEAAKHQVSGHIQEVVQDRLWSQNLIDPNINSLLPPLTHIGDMDTWNSAVDRQRS